ncbi:hypothetical protein [Endothiovibrio diazotrophicus]
MPLSYDEQTISIEGVCGVEEAESLLEWLNAHPDGAIDLLRCEHIHSAPLQVLLAARPPIVAAPGDEFLARWLLPLFKARRET